MGTTPDISPWAQFAWYEWVMFYDEKNPYPNDRMVLGRDLGPSKSVGPAMTRKVLKANGKIVHRLTVRSLTKDEWDSPEHKAKRKSFDKKINKMFGKPLTHTDIGEDPDLQDIETPTFEPYQDDVDGQVDCLPDIDDVDPENYDLFVGAEVMLAHSDQVQKGKVVGRKRQADGSLKGKANSKPMLDTRTYEVEFPDGQRVEHSANAIAEGMYSQCDLEGRQHLLMESIVDYRTTGAAVERADMYIQAGSNRQLKKTTAGWELCVEWKDGSTSWMKLGELKQSYPIEVAEFAVARSIADEPAFIWWVPYVLSRRKRIIAAVNKRYHKKTHSFGIKLPKSVQDAVRLDAENGNTLWQDAIAKEMKNIRVAYDILPEGKEVPIGYQHVRCHWIFSIKIEDFKRKARLVAQGNTTEAPNTLTYASVVSRESVRIALTLAALNDLDVKSADIENAYLTAPASEKIWTTCGPEFGPDAGKKAIIVRAHYGLRSAGASFRNHLAACMKHSLGWQPCKADPDLWMKPQTDPRDGHKYYAYVLLFVDDALVIAHNATEILEQMNFYFKMKEGSIGDPDYYLGAKLKKTIVRDPKTEKPQKMYGWGMSSSKYVKSAVNNVKEHLQEQGRELPRRAATPFASNYRPEVDCSPELSPYDANYFQSQIGILRWTVELGRVDILTEASMLASHLALPREGHLEAVYHIFAYLDKKHNARMVFNPDYPEVDKTKFKDCDWREFYGNAEEAIPENAPEPRGRQVELTLYVDSDHANDELTRRSRSGYFIFLNKAPISWFSKKQATVETSVFGAEFVAMKIGMEALRGLRYKLRMMGVPIAGPSHIYGDNMSVIHNTQRPESVLKKKSNSICYHAIREAVAMGECLTAHVSTNDNPADLLTKSGIAGEKRRHLIRFVLYDLADDHD